MTSERPLLERDEHMAARESISAAVGGRGRLILVGGEAGVGKTTLTRRFASRLDGVQVLIGETP